jgi:hypothetical protein
LFELFEAAKRGGDWLISKVRNIPDSTSNTEYSNYFIVLLYLSSSPINQGIMAERWGGRDGD